MARRMLLAVDHLPPGPDALGLVALATDLAPSDVRLRLTGILPRVLLTDDDLQRVREVAAALAKLGVLTLCCDPADAPSDSDRVVARHLELSHDGFVAVDHASQRHPVPATSVVLLQRGFRFRTSREEVKIVEKKLSFGRAVLTGGLVWSKPVSKSSSREIESREAFLLVQRLGGQRDVMLYEKQLDYRFLGADLKPAAYANLALTVECLRTLTPRVALDERVGQQAFVQALRPAAVGDPLDLALHLVRLAQTVGHPFR